MPDLPCNPPATPALLPAERFTLWIVRRAQRTGWPCQSAKLIEMATAFREVLQPAPTSATPPSRDERRVLRATAATQAGDMALADNFLFKLALARAARARLTQAVVTLAAFVGGRGHRLAVASPFTLPGAALQVARLHGCDLAATAVTWPQIAPLAPGVKL